MLKIKKRKANQKAKERILDSACKEFAKKGFAGARMHSIAKAAKVNTAMLHYYYCDKRKLHLAVLVDLFKVKGYESLLRNMESLRLSDPGEKLCVAIYMFIRLQFHHSSEYKHQIIAWEIAEGRKNLKKMVQNLFIPHIERLESLVEEGIKEEYFEAKYPLLAVMNIIWFVVSYRMHELVYSGSRIYKRLYQKNQEEVLFEFISEHTFRSLLRERKDSPKRDENLLRKVNQYIQQIDPSI